VRPDGNEHFKEILGRSVGESPFLANRGRLCSRERRRTRADDEEFADVVEFISLDFSRRVVH
jgi:hypothetical protein